MTKFGESPIRIKDVKNTIVLNCTLIFILTMFTFVIRFSVDKR